MSAARLPGAAEVGSHTIIKESLILEEIRERLTELVKKLPDDKLQMLLDFANRLYDEHQEGEDPDDELLMN